MRHQTTTTIITYSLLALAGGISFVLPEDLGVQGAAAEPAAGDTIRLPGVVRDFKKTNANFCTPPAGGNGHYARNISVGLSAEGRPVFLGGGFKVATQWREQNNHPIAPHMYLNAAEARKVRLVNAPAINNNPTIDTFDSTSGAYGVANKGPAPTFVAGSAVPAVALPVGMPALVNEILYDGAGTTVMGSDLHCNKFLLRNDRLLQVSGNRRLRVKEEFKIENFARVELLPNASLTIWVEKDATIQNNVQLNSSTSDPSRLLIHNVGPNNFVIENSSQTYARIAAPNGGLHVKNSGQFFGTFTGKNVTIDNGCGFHIDTGRVIICNVDADDDLGVAGTASSGGIASASTFDQWYDDTMGVNLSTVHSIELVNNGSGIYEYHDDEFHPVDHQLFGNEGQSHNNFFTYAISTTFVFDKCAGQFFEFEGADDAWLFINGNLVIDLGGIIPGTGQYIDMDRLTLIDGKTYSFNFFYAQRNASISRFHMRTNLPLDSTVSVATVSGSGD